MNKNECEKNDSEIPLLYTEKTILYIDSVYFEQIMNNANQNNELYFDINNDCSYVKTPNHLDQTNFMFRSGSGSSIMDYKML